MVEKRTGKAARKDQLGNRLRHAENYTDAVIPYNFAASRVIVKVACEMSVAQFYGKAVHRFRMTFSPRLPDDLFFLSARTRSETTKLVLLMIDVRSLATRSGLAAISGYRN